ncbi:methyltransferase [Planosporangium thailandense]|uniref:Methyltransferase n=1 Tax=Planosporangium thailandense TaxID=765197 RepID=A0ABX0Y588_9ACTN|nr:50S ribosomal protein L11 methyltransferase [Planosporangium thailandense]NJC73203.1 methyltransferase [Planosporangium thailandense]
MNRTAPALTTDDRPVLDPFVVPDVAGHDGLRLAEVPFVPEVRLHLAEDAIVLRARLEAQVGAALPPPFWADAWAGGQAVARYVLDHRDVVAGLRVLDVASGSGLVAIAAAVAGAAAVTANDIDPYALAAIALNAHANDVAVEVSRGDLLGGDGDDAQVVLAGDVFYSRSMAERMLPFLHRAAARGARVLVGDPGRAYLPHDSLEVVASYQVSMIGAPEDAQIRQVYVLELRR